MARRMVIVLAAAGLAACSAYPRTEADFGNSVRHMIASQAVTTGPVDRNPVETGDGQRLEGVIEAYRSGASEPREVVAPLVLDVGGSGRR